ncbi:glutamine-dependent nad(+) synthetase [Stemphylium lycopersici]|uniref:NAD(+) synthase (glutamine-hydrolyzing) n=1 Tax=Stemphylium lycopersici TaxID=183478 RepID=A0A364MRP2_STELY|nr:glutamine-dependent nad(+) synthetase [Stemphylium lycopersici]
MCDILIDENCNDVLVDIGMPVKHKNARYIWTDGNYEESRWFTAWDPSVQAESFCLPQCIADLQGNNEVPIGDVLISTAAVCIGTLTPDELFRTEPSLPTAQISESVDIFTVSAANHFCLGNFNSLVTSLQSTGKRIGGVILYSNQHGCDGDQTYYDGGPMVLVNGEVISQGSRFSVQDVEVVTAVVDIDAVQAYRTKHQLLVPLEDTTSPRVEIACSLYRPTLAAILLDHHHPSVWGPKIYSLEEEIAMGPACYLWHYLRRSDCAGFLAPLSGGIDSCSTAVIVLSMCYLVFDALRDGNEVAMDVQRVIGTRVSLPKTPQELCNRILHTVYLGVTGCSSEETCSRAQRLAEGIGAHHIDMSIDTVYQAERDLLPQYTGFTPDFKGSTAENLALQNLQARLRATTAYYLARMLPTIRKRPGEGGLLVLSSVNVEESLRGNLTKHDCSSADLSPIGSISKIQLQSFIRWARIAFNLPILSEFLEAIPRAELEPTGFGQCDDKDNGMTQEELFVFAKLRSDARLGPYDMFQRLLHDWRDQKHAREVGDLVKTFWTFYGKNRHKMAAVTPAIHATEHNADNRFDRRPMLYPSFDESLTFRHIDEVVDRQEREVFVEDYDEDLNEKIFDIREEDDPEELVDILHPQRCLPYPLHGKTKDWLLQVFKGNQGFELGTFNASILATVMKKQSSKWEDISMGFNAIASAGFLLKVEKSNTPMTMNHYFNDSLQRSHQGKVTAHVKKNAFHNGSHGMVVRLEHAEQPVRSMSNEQHVVQDIHDILKSYYKVCRKTFVDSVCRQSVIHYLLECDDSPLALFSPMFVSQLSADALEEITGEAPGLKRSWEQLTKEVASLDKAVRILTRI